VPEAQPAACVVSYVSSSQPPECASTLIPSWLLLPVAAGSPYERKQTALELLVLLLTTWGTTHQGEGEGGGGCTSSSNSWGSGAGSGERASPNGSSSFRTMASPPPAPPAVGATTATAACPNGGAAAAKVKGALTPARAALLGPFNPLCRGLLSADGVEVLVAGAVDSWDKLREGCCR
jgi:hypothetical protein